jgi:hypothetical protein
MKPEQILEKIKKVNTKNLKGLETQYHTVFLDKKYKGSRDPSDRHIFPYCFYNKKVLDIGTNLGSMLFYLGTKPSKGLGLDRPYIIEIANDIKKYHGYNNLIFKPMDLVNDPELYDIIKQKWDITFYLAMCIHLNNNEEILKHIGENSKSLLFEINTSGKRVTKENQLKIVSKYYNYIKYYGEFNGRYLYFCTNTENIKVGDKNYEAFFYQKSANCDVWLSKNNEIIKKYHKINTKKSELNWLNKNMNISPKIIYEKDNFIVETWEGNLLTAWSRPENYEKQLINIKKEFTENNCDGLDVEPVVLDDKIKIIDYNGCKSGKLNPYHLQKRIKTPDNFAHYKGWVHK